jgi:hypothetical protein
MAQMIDTGIIDSDGHELFVRIPTGIDEVGIVAYKDKKAVHSIYIRKEDVPVLVKKLEEVM